MNIMTLLTCCITLALAACMPNTYDGKQATERCGHVESCHDGHHSHNPRYHYRESHEDAQK